MKTRLILLSLLALAACSAQEDFTAYVNPNIGTVHSRWFVYTPAAVPFGMAKLGASTNGTYGNHDGWEAVGYEDSHTSIDGFPCFHEFQVGGLALMPVRGEVITTPGVLENPDEGWRSRFEKAEEQAEPGYYAVRLGDYDTRVELTATQRVAFQRFRFSEGENHLLVNVGTRQGESGAVRDAYAETDGTHLWGYVVTEPEYVKRYQSGASVSMFFYGDLSLSPRGVRAFHVGDETLAARGDFPATKGAVSGPGAVLCLDYEGAGEVTVRLGLSYTSVENAQVNFERETGASAGRYGLNFDTARSRAHALWRNELGKIAVYGGSEESRIKFYTGLYHCLLGRGLASDCNGAYPRNDGGIGQIPLDEAGNPIHNHYNTDAIWGGYWNLTPLWALAWPEYYNDWVSSQLLVYRDAGWLGDGIACSRYVSGVGTNMVSIAFAGAYNSGIRQYDVETMYEAARKDNLEWEGRLPGAGKMDVERFVKDGYVPYVDGWVADSRGATFSVSHTLEYGFSAYATAQLARQLGKDADYARLMELSDGWAKVFDDDCKMVRPRVSGGAFIENFSPLESWRGFQEGNAMQYTYFVPQHPDSLIARVGKECFNARLDSIFTEARKSIFGGGKTAYAFSGLASPYNHGNQPSLHIPWLFNFSGKPSLTQKWTRLICDEFYGTDGEHGYGYGQDEDQGQLGSWYVLAAMGLFDVQGGAPERPTYQLGSPAFDRIVIRLSPMNASGKTLTIRTKGNGPEHYYVQSARFNGQALEQCWLYRDELYKGGVLDLTLSSEPSDCWDESVVPVSR
ncbi:MAG: GH92 family glycosyl hydrolase [Bacteroidales bacterium]|nr:GH92 family glycosyl hydrolase [Bacteroidales bacterium]